jgi:hypothetical protein
MKQIFASCLTAGNSVSEVETMKIVSLGLEDHSLRSHSALKRLVPKSGVLPPDTFF